MLLLPTISFLGTGDGSLPIPPEIMASSPRAAYSLRKVNAAYSGSCIKVRRSSDNTEQDIGFAFNDLDIAGLAAFVGANSGYVSKWYDQSGNANDAVMATTSKQPRIVNSGTLETTDSKPVMRFPTADNTIGEELTMPFAFGDGAFTVLVSAHKTSPSNNFTFVTQWFATERLGLGATTTGRVALMNSAGASFEACPDAAVGSFNNLQVFGYSSTVSVTVTEGAAIRTTLNGSEGARLFRSGWSGARGSTSSFGGRQFGDGRMREAFVYSSDLAPTARKGIEAVMCTDTGRTLEVASAPASTAYGLSGLQGVYGFRKIVSDYAGPCITAMRTSDSVIQNFGFSSGELDTAALATFAGANTVVVVLWHDQTGQGNGYYSPGQSSSAPKIVDAGTLQTLDGTHPAIKINQSLTSGVVPFDSAWTFVASIKRAAAAYNALLSRPLSTASLSVGFTNATAGAVDLQCNGVTDTSGSQTVTNGTPAVVGFRSSGAFTTGNYTVTPSKDGPDGSTLTVNYSTRTPGQRRSTLGASAAAGDVFTNGLFGEFALASSSLSTGDQNAIETSMGTRFGVTIT